MSSALQVYNVITKEIAAIFAPADRQLADKLVETLRRNCKARGEHGASGWTLVELSNDNDNGDEA
jgi:hypothetical protein